jgi:hypothetical protein
MHIDPYFGNTNKTKILISFTLVTVLTIVIALFWWYMDLIETAAERKFSLDLFNGSIRTSLQTQSLGWLREDRRKRWAKIAQQLILALSDQQLVTVRNFPIQSWQ